jgi:hypothetical protein
MNTKGRERGTYSKEEELSGNLPNRMPIGNYLDIILAN